MGSDFECKKAIIGLLNQYQLDTMKKYGKEALSGMSYTVLIDEFMEEPGMANFGVAQVRECFKQLCVVGDVVKGKYDLPDSLVFSGISHSAVQKYL